MAGLAKLGFTPSARASSFYNAAKRFWSKHKKAIIVGYGAKVGIGAGLGYAYASNKTPDLPKYDGRPLKKQGERNVT